MPDAQGTQMDGIIERLGGELDDIVQELNDYRSVVLDDIDLDVALADFHIDAINESLNLVAGRLKNPPREGFYSFLRLAEVFGPELFATAYFDWSDELKNAQYTPSPELPRLAEQDLPAIVIGPEPEDEQESISDRVSACTYHFWRLDRYFDEVWRAACGALKTLDWRAVDIELEKLPKIAEELNSAYCLWEAETSRQYECAPGSLGATGEVMQDFERLLALRSEK